MMPDFAYTSQTRNAFNFILLFGIVSLCADVTYEGARSITGPYLSMLGATGTIVGLVAGGGELLGYTLRLFSGYLADRTKQYWVLTIMGYALSLGAVPLLTFADHWVVAAGLLTVERIGKAVRTPARDAMLSHATSEVGRGWGFGVHEALDQVGAILGPLLMMLVLLRGHDYHTGFAILAVPAFLAIALVVYIYRRYPHPKNLEQVSLELEMRGFQPRFWLYLTAVCLIAAGYADYSLIAYHFITTSVMSETSIPLLYAIAMAVDGLAALVFGYLYDTKGIATLAVASIISALFAPFVFLGGLSSAVIGAIFWGIGMGAQESIMRAAIPSMVPASKRASAYGIFTSGFGLSWFLGSALMGWLYDVYLPALIVFSVTTQLGAALLFLYLPTHKQFRPSNNVDLHTNHMS
jgi:MFS family permease